MSYAIISAYLNCPIPKDKQEDLDMSTGYCWKITNARVFKHTPLLVDFPITEEREDDSYYRGVLVPSFAVAQAMFPNSTLQDDGFIDETRLTDGDVFFSLAATFPKSEPEYYPNENERENPTVPFTKEEIMALRSSNS